MPKTLTADYAWIIDREHDDRGERTVRIVGPSHAADSLVAALEAGKGERFRLYDDDGELNLSGRILYVDPEIVDGFEPLDDYGTGGYGCTEIRFRNDAGAWTTL